MKNRFTISVLIFLVICLFLTACSIKPSELTVDDSALLEVPGLKWGMTPEEVKEALSLSDKQMATDQMVDSAKELSFDEWVIIADDLDFFDCEIQGVYFHFYRYAGDEFGLAKVELYYPDDTDIPTLKDELINIYGEGATEKITVSFDSEGNPSYTDMTKVWKGLYEQWWESKSILTTVFSKEEQDAILTRYAALHPLASQETIEEVLADAHVSLDCGKISEEVESYRKDNPYISHIHLSYNAVTLVEWMQRFGKCCA